MENRNYMIIADNKTLGIYNNMFLDTILAVASILFKEVTAIEITKEPIQ